MYPSLWQARLDRFASKRSRRTTEGSENDAQGATHMRDNSKFAAAGATRPHVVFERTYQARRRRAVGAMDHQEGLRVLVGA